MATIVRRPHYVSSYGYGGMARGLETILGNWLVVSAMFYDQPHLARELAGLLGTAILVLAIADFWIDGIRRVNTAIAVALAASVIAFHLRGGSLANNLIVAALVFATSIVPTRPLSMGAEPGP
jgi:hypothetical protein